MTRVSIIADVASREALQPPVQTQGTTIWVHKSLEFRMNNPETHCKWYVRIDFDEEWTNVQAVTLQVALWIPCSIQCLACSWLSRYWRIPVDLAFPIQRLSPDGYILFDLLNRQVATVGSSRGFASYPPTACSANIL